MSNPTVSFVVVNWGEVEATLECVASIRSQAVDALLEIIVVDNASSPRSLARLRTIDPPVRVITHEKNLGFAAGANSGLAEATGKYIAVVNNDCVLAKDWVRAGLEALSDPSVGIVGGLEYSWDDANPAFDVRNECRSRTIVDAHLGFSRRISGRSRSAAVISLDGSALLARQELLHRLRGFEPSFFTYYEDVDFCARCLAVGSGVRFVEQMAVWHRRGVTSARQPVRRRMRSDRNHVLLVARHFPESEWRRVVRLLTWRYLSTAVLGTEGSIRQRARDPVLSIGDRLGHLFAGLWLATHRGALRRSRRAVVLAGEHDEGYRDRLELAMASSDVHQVTS